MDNLNLNTVVAGQTLLDVGGCTTTGLDYFVAGRLYETMEESGISLTTTLAGSAGTEMLSATQARSLDTLLGAGTEMLSATVAVSDVVADFSAGLEMVHVVTIPGGRTAVLAGAGTEILNYTRKTVPGEAIPGGMLRLGVGI